MSELMQSINHHKIQKSLNLLGLKLSETELNELKTGKTVSLEGRGLSEIGSLFILASALSTSILGKTKNTITFRDLPEAVTESTCCSGIPIYCWNCDPPYRKCCLYLTLVHGKPAVQTCCEI
jgi:hypothetical protein